MSQNSLGGGAFTGTGCGVTIHEKTASANYFASTTASPSSLASIMRSSVLLRPIGEPLSFPLDTENFREVES